MHLTEESRTHLRFRRSCTAISARTAGAMMISRIRGGDGTAAANVFFCCRTDRMSSAETTAAAARRLGSGSARRRDTCFDVGHSRSSFSRVKRSQNLGTIQPPARWWWWWPSSPLVLAAASAPQRAAAATAAAGCRRARTTRIVVAPPHPLLSPLPAAAGRCYNSCAHRLRSCCLYAGRHCCRRRVRSCCTVPDGGMGGQSGSFVCCCRSSPTRTRPLLRRGGTRNQLHALLRVHVSLQMSRAPYPRPPPFCCRPLLLLA